MSVNCKFSPLPSPNADIRGQFAETMRTGGLMDDCLVVMVGDISHFALQPFAEACPGRYYNIGICEPASVSMAAGLSRAGLYPVFHTIAPFIVERSLEQIKLDLIDIGLDINQITISSECTYENKELCSYRRDGDLSGRMISIIKRK